MTTKPFIALLLPFVVLLTACSYSKSTTMPITNPLPATQPSTVDSNQLLGSWSYQRYDNFKHTPVQATTLTFDGERGTAFAGCNLLHFAYQLKDNILIINTLTSTRMACDDLFENEFVQFLRTPLIVKLEQDRMGNVVVLSNQENKSIWLTQPFNKPN